MDEKFRAPENGFRTTKEEISAISQKVEGLLPSGREDAKVSPDEAISREIKNYGQIAPEVLLHPEYRIPEAAVERIVLDLSPETHDGKMSELVVILKEKGLRNALSVFEKMGNPHIEDDFHRYLVEYLKEGFAVPGLKEKSDMDKALGLSLYKISLPDSAA